MYANVYEDRHPQSYKQVFMARAICLLFVFCAE